MIKIGWIDSIHRGKVRERLAEHTVGFFRQISTFASL
jgi:hypothetical protein